MSQINNAIGGTLVITSGAQSYTQWVTENLSLLSFSLTFTSAVAGVFFLWLNWYTSTKAKKRDSEARRVEAEALRKLREREVIAQEKALIKAPLNLQ